MSTSSGENLIDELQTSVYKELLHMSPQALHDFGFANLNDEDSLILFCIYTSIVKHQLCGAIPLMNAWKANKVDEFVRGRFTPNVYYIAWFERELHIPRHAGAVDHSLTLFKYDQCPLCFKDDMMKREVELHGDSMSRCNVCNTRVCIDCYGLKKCPVCGTNRSKS